MKKIDQVIGPVPFVSGKITLAVKYSGGQFDFEPLISDRLNSCKQSISLNTAGCCHNADAVPWL
ncbi:MAG TPA: hypothetical protein VF089_00165 [Candidatus Binatia bacterium]